MRSAAFNEYVPSNVRRAADFFEYNDALKAGAEKLSPEKRLLATDQVQRLWDTLVAFFDAEDMPPEEAVMREIERRRMERLRLARRRREERELLRVMLSEAAPA